MPYPSGIVQFILLYLQSHESFSDRLYKPAFSLPPPVDNHLLSTYSGVGHGFGVVLYSLTGSTIGKAVKQRVIALLILPFVLLEMPSPVDLPHHRYGVVEAPLCNADFLSTESKEN